MTSKEGFPSFRNISSRDICSYDGPRRAPLPVRTGSASSPSGYPARDLKNIVIDNPEILPASPGRSYPEFPENHTRQRDLQEREDLFSEFRQYFQPVTDMRAGPLDPDKDRQVPAEDCKITK